MQRFVRFYEIQARTEAGRPGNKTDLHPPGSGPFSTRRADKRPVAGELNFPLNGPLPSNYSPSLALQHQPGVM